MKTIKVPRRIKPDVSEVDPEGNILLGYTSVDFSYLTIHRYDTIKNIWSKQNITTSRRRHLTTYMRQPLHMMLPPKPIKGIYKVPEIVMDVVVNGKKNQLSLSTVNSFEAIYFFNAPFGMVIFEVNHAKIENELILHVAEFDWKNIPEVVTFRKIGKFNDMTFGFHTSPTRLAYSGKGLLLPDTTAGIIDATGEFPIVSTLELPRNHKMLGACILNSESTVGLLGEKNGSTGRLLQFWKGTMLEREMILPFRGHTLHVSYDNMMATIIGHAQITQIDIE